MSKRARITLTPEPVEADSVTGARPTAEATEAGPVESLPEATVETPSEAGRETSPKAPPKVTPDGEMKPQAGMGNDTTSPAQSTMETEQEAPADMAARPGLDQGADLGRRPSATSAPPSQAASGFYDESAEATQQPTPAAGKWDLGTALKAAVVGLAIVSVILWLKRKP